IAAPSPIGAPPPVVLNRVARPAITTPTANSEVPADEDLGVAVSINVGDVRYRFELTDITDEVPGEPVVWDEDPLTAGLLTTPIGGEPHQAGRVSRRRLFVPPDDGDTPPNLDHVITVTTPE